MNKRRHAAAVVVLALFMSLLASAPAAGASGACAGVSRCKIATRRDVDGDGRRDQVGIVRRADRSSVVRVATADGRLLRRRVNSEYWPIDDSWYGAAAIDGRKGKELVVGHMMGAHTMFFHVLTYRHGDLTFLPAPGGGRTWTVDASWRFNLGIWRLRRDGDTFITVRSATRDDDGTGHGGVDTRYQWAAGRWQERWTKSRRYAHDEDAYRIGGWHVRGLRVYL